MTQLVCSRSRIVCVVPSVVVAVRLWRQGDDDAVRTIENGEREVSDTVAMVVANRGVSQLIGARNGTAHTIPCVSVTI